MGFWLTHQRIGFHLFNHFVKFLFLYSICQGVAHAIAASLFYSNLLKHFLYSVHSVSFDGSLPWVQYKEQDNRGSRISPFPLLLGWAWGQPWDGGVGITCHIGASPTVPTVLFDFSLNDRYELSLRVSQAHIAHFANKYNFLREG